MDATSAKANSASLPITATSKSGSDGAPAPAIQSIAFYLPQFHPTPENDEWWGPGFTEWTNTAKARALFPGHRQPHLPADLGFYDLRLAESRQAQAELAQRYGVGAFCYWHYWFGAGRRILERPFSEVLGATTPALPFCLGWANQTWTGVWHAAPNRILMQQQYLGVEDEVAHFAALLPAFRDPRYLTVDGRPVFYIFRPEELPEPARFIDHWQTLAVKAGLPGMYFVAEISDLLGAGPRYTSAQQDGFDAGVYIRLPAEVTPASTRRMRVIRKTLGGPEIYPHAASLPDPPQAFRSDFYDPCVYPNWDNSPRSGRRGLVVTGSTPSLFETHVRQAAARVADRPTERRFVWVKSWNEWAEGNYLEPDLEFGHGWLQALKRGLSGPQSEPAATATTAATPGP